MSEKKLFLIDGSAMAYRAYFAFIRNPLVTRRGEHTSAIFGFLNSLFKVINDFDPTHLAIFFDTPAPTFRHDIYPEYKSTRTKMPDDMAVQLPRLREVIDAMGIPRLEKEGLEADDLIGAYSVKAAEDGAEVVIVTGDKDFTQLVNDRIKILLPGKSAENLEILDREGVKEKMGVYPDQITELLALMGDSSDNVPGIKGVGQKTALNLLDQFGSLEDILENAEKIKQKGLRKKVSEGREDAILSRELVTIKTDLDIEQNYNDFELKPWQNDEVRELFKELEFTRFIDEMESLGSPGSSPSKPKPKFEQVYRLIDSMESLDSFLHEVRKKKEVTFDTETTGLHPMTAALVGLSFCVEPGKAYYLAVAHDDYDGNLPLAAVLGRLVPVMENADISKCGQNVKYDYLILRNAGIEMEGIRSDPMIAAYLIDPSARQYGLSFLAEEHLGYRMQPITDLIGTGRKQKSFSTVPVDKAVFYSAEDADCTFRIRDKLEPLLDEVGMRKLYDEIEMPLVKVLAEMEFEGVRLDTDHLSKLSEVMQAELDKCAEMIYEAAGEEFNINSTQQLSSILFEKIGLKPVRKTSKKTGYSTDQSVLEKLAEEHPLPALILEHRQYQKLKSTYVDALPLLINGRTGRVHTSYNQTIAATGRLSSSDPNLQNIPIRTTVGAEIRRAFVPRDEDHILLGADYSQVELRIMAHYSKDPTMIETFERGEDIHARTASEVYGVPLDQVTPDMRRRAKTANFAVIYGVSAYGLSQQSDMDVGESSRFIETYFERYPGIRQYMDEWIEHARTNHFVTTLLGRRRYIPDIESGNRQMRQFAERIAINTPIQGTAADIIKLAMIRIFDELRSMKSKMILQVHDELVFDVHKSELDVVREMVRREMEGVYELRVPLEADIASGPNWLECK